MKRPLLARALGVFFGLLALMMLWNGVDSFRYTRGAVEYSIGVLQMLSAPPLAITVYWLWRRDQRAVPWCATSTGFAAVIGTMAATHWSEPPEKLSAGLGALGASIVLLVIVVLLARLAVNAPRSEPASAPRIGL